MTSYFANSANLAPYLSGGGANHHEQYNHTNGDLGHHMMATACHDTGRGPPIGPPQLLHYSHHQHHQPIHYANHQPQYPRFPPYDRLDVKHCVDVPNQVEPSPYYNSCGPNVVPPPSQGHSPSLTSMQSQPQPYECTGRGSITPPSLEGSNGPNGGQYGACKMQPTLLSHNDSMTPLCPDSPSPQMYGSGPMGSPSQNSNSAISSPLYPWMRSQFGESTFSVSIVSLSLCAI